MGAIYMILNLLIKHNKKILNKMIEKNEDYSKILEQSQKLDIYITKKQKKLYEKAKNKK